MEEDESEEKRNTRDVVCESSSSWILFRSRDCLSVFSGGVRARDSSRGRW